MSISRARILPLLTVIGLVVTLALFPAWPTHPVRGVPGIPPPAQRGGEPRVPATDTPFIILRKQLKDARGKVRNIKFYRENQKTERSVIFGHKLDHLSRVVIRGYSSPTTPISHPATFTRALTEKEIIALNLAKDGGAVEIRIPEMRKMFERGAIFFSVDSKLWAQEIRGTTPIGGLKLSADSSTVQPLSNPPKKEDPDRRVPLEQRLRSRQRQ